MSSAEDYIVNNTREIVPGLITGGMELSGSFFLPLLLVLLSTRLFPFPSTRMTIHHSFANT